ncbi:MAG: threonine--tRNA ligase [Candidatus Acidulodesulfobacterium ferriphilum]|uniref:Threonine--tRNA ligase n=1 Tax=Candidatus Acidulodesulfobacterium ferriphilum TaxID=2597223 RepID=A0A519BC59_9DELT|nr:MAG: threonine--tRNA ligase [Candidatus Acidulodesulfobacterium ferriphilum]
MQLLIIHADTFSYALTGKTPVAEEIDVNSVKESEVSFKDPLVVFCTVEKGDASDAYAIVKKAFYEIKGISEKLKPRIIVLYPYAHLSNSLAEPSFAVKTLNSLKTELESIAGVYRAPFGWYKSFKISCKGHPLSESSRHIVSESAPNQAIHKTREDVVKDVESEFFILDYTGAETKINLNDKNILAGDTLKDFPSLRKVIAFEEFKIKDGATPPSVAAMRRLEIADHEENSDSGHLRLYPKGTLLYKLLSDWAEDIALNRLKCMEIETPLIYNWNKPEIKGQGESFHERHYSVFVPDEKSESGGFAKGKEFVLRFAGDFGLFSMLKDAKISYKQLPLRFYEFSKSFRYEKSGELSGLRRLRGFTMPDIHSFCLNLEEGFNEYQVLYKQYADLAEAAKIEYAVVFRIVKEYYDKYKDKIIELLKYSKKPALIETLSKMKHYWALKHEFQGVDSVNGSCQLSTVQLDVEDAKRYGINFVNENGEKEGCIICHSSVGAIERWMYLILEEALKKNIPVLPLWLSITQVRIIPVSDKFLDFAVKLKEKLFSSGIRVDIDDRDFSLGKKIMFAEEEWVPYIVVVGHKEAEGGVLPVRNRYKERKNFNLNEEELIKEIKGGTKNMPYRNLILPDMVSKRPIFVG